MKVKYNRTSTIQQEGKRFDLDKNEYDLTLFDKGVSGKIPGFTLEEVTTLFNTKEGNALSAPNMLSFEEANRQILDLMFASPIC